MAEPGDLPPRTPPGDEHDDDLIGFASPASLQGRARAAEPEAERLLEPEPEPEPEPELVPEPEPEPEPAREPDLFAPVEEADPLPPQPASVEAGSIFAPSPEFSSRRRRRDAGRVLPGGGMGLYAVYALILFALPTMGVSALIGLLAVTGRAGPDDDLSSSHFVYQQRTLWAAAVAAVAGVILLAAPFALGVPILFFLAIWVVLRGASGVWTLKSGRAIADPRGWWL